MKTITPSNHRHGAVTYSMATGIPVNHLRRENIYHHPVIEFLVTMAVLTVLAIVFFIHPIPTAATLVGLLLIALVRALI